MDETLIQKNATTAPADVAPSYANENVLVIEDNGINQRVYKLFLAHIQCPGDFASTGAQAMAMLNDSYSIIFMDLGLPDTDGVTLCREIMKVNPNIPIVAITAFTAEGVRAECLAAGMKDVAQKPFMVEDLSRLIQRWSRNSGTLLQAG